MFEERNNMDSDLLMRSILESGQEEVPAHVWEGVSAGLDALERRRKVALWWRRSAVAGAVSAVAAAVAAVLFLNPSGNEMDVVPSAAGSDMIAVVTAEPAGDEAGAEVAEAMQEAAAEADAVALLAEARPGRASGVKAAEHQDGMKPEEKAEKQAGEPKTPEAGPDQSRPSENRQIAETETIRFPESWEEEEIVRKKIRTSLVFAGLAGTNSVNGNVGRSLVKRPSLSNEQMKTTVKETSTQSSYGIPVSFGAGVRIGLAPKWSLSAGLNYSMLSRTFYGDYTKVTDGSVEYSISSDIRNVQHYIGIPVNVYYNILESDNMSFYAYAGGTAEKCITNRYDVLSTSIVHKDNPSGLQLSANAGIGVEFMLGRHLGFYIDPSLRYYFDNNQPKSIRTAQPLTLGFEMGLRVNL